MILFVWFVVVCIFVIGLVFDFAALGRYWLVLLVCCLLFIWLYDLHLSGCFVVFVVANAFDLVVFNSVASWFYSLLF